MYYKITSLDVYGENNILDPEKVELKLHSEPPVSDKVIK